MTLFIMLKKYKLFYKLINLIDINANIISCNIIQDILEAKKERERNSLFNFETILFSSTREC